MSIAARQTTRSQDGVRSTTRPPGPGHAHPAVGRVPQSWGNQALQRMLRSGAIQAKLTVNQPGDVYEQEADRLADQIVRMPEPSQGQAGVATTVRPPQVQRLCAECEKEKEEQNAGSVPQVQRQEAEEEGVESAPAAETETLDDFAKMEDTIEETNESYPGGDEEGGGVEAEAAEEEAVFTKRRSSEASGPPQVDGPPAGGGRPLDEATQARFERYFDRDFSSVRLHTDATANRFADRLGAHAATVGNQIYFAAGAEASGGQRLLAHEMTHVVQQGRAPALQMHRREPSETRTSDLEGEAERVSSAFMADRPSPVTGHSPIRPQLRQDVICKGKANEHKSTQPKDFPDTYISEVKVSLADQKVSLVWTGPSKAGQPVGPFNCTTGAGVCGQTSCNDKAHSRSSDSCCTPKGIWTVGGFSCVTNKLKLRNFTGFQRSGVGLHTYKSLPRRPGSHGCVRLAEKTAQIVFDSTRKGVSKINVSGDVKYPCRYTDCGPTGKIKCPCPGPKSTSTGGSGGTTPPKKESPSVT